MMRTTLTIDDDLAGILQQQARELDRPFKEIVNTALRKGLAESMVGKPHTVIVRPHDFGDSKAGVDMNRLTQVVDELAVEDYLQKAAKAVIP